MTVQPLASHPSSDRCESDRLAGHGKSERGRFCAVFRRNTRADDPMAHNLRCTDSLLAMRQVNDIARRIKRGVGWIGERDQGHVGSTGGNGKARKAIKLCVFKKFYLKKILCLLPLLPKPKQAANPPHHGGLGCKKHRFGPILGSSVVSIDVKLFQQAKMACCQPFRNVALGDEPAPARSPHPGPQGRGRRRWR